MEKLKLTEKTNFLLTGTLFIIAVIVFTIFINSRKPSGGESEIAISTAIRSFGPNSALIKIEEFSDFGCITCRVWHQTGISTDLISEYGDKIQFIWHDFPVITSNSPKAAEAGFCANDQGAFWEYHDTIFDNYPRLSVDDLKFFAMQIGLDTQSFNSCLDSSKYKQAVESEMELGYAHGFRSTPSFMVNEKPLIGPPSYEQLSTLIDELLETNNNGQ